MQRTIEDLVAECREFITLNNKNKMMRNPAVGQPSFVINKNWLRNYKQYIYYQEVKRNNKPTQRDDDSHPGPIDNDESLCDNNTKNMVGTGTIEQFERNHVDKYLRSDVSERYQFKVINQELWNFLYSKYGGSEIRRYNIPQGQYYTTVETRLKSIPVVVLPVSKLYSGGEQLLDLDTEYNVQISKRKNYSDLKKRIVDCLNSKLYQGLTENEVRLWKFSETKDKLVDACQQISERTQIEIDSSNNPDLEHNSGVEFPGETLEPFLNTAQTLEDDTLYDAHLIVEVKDSQERGFAFTFVKNQRIFIGKCEFCTQRKILKIECPCKRVRYCNDSCLEKDKRWHLPNCSAQADAELKKGVSNFQRSSTAKDGKVGLSNLGNTCYMNSSLQCLSNCWELTKYFLDERFKTDLNEGNPLGTAGRLVQAYAKLLNEMWNQDDSVVRPIMFKRILGEYAQQFQGYGQHDSQECINSILDLLSEDLYRKEKKPYVEMTEANGKSDDKASEEAWTKHLIRNESIIVDLFHGQYKSTLVCSKCPKVSITFDPFMTLSLPIPGKKEKFSFFYIPYNIKQEAKNSKGDIHLRETETISEFRHQIEKKFQVNSSSFIITIVQDNVIKKMVDQNSKVEELQNNAGVILLYEINPELNPQLPPGDQSDKSDSNYGVSDEWTKTVLYMMTPQRNTYSAYCTIKHNNIPRIMWINKEWSLKQVHYEIFKFFRESFIGMYNASQKPPFKKQSIDENDTGKPLSKEEFEALSLEDQFQTAFPTLNEENWKELLSKTDLDLSQALYTLRIRNLSGYMESCHFCQDKKCEGCPLPFIQDASYKDLLSKIGVKQNNSFYNDGYKRGKQDVILEIVWNSKIEKAFFDGFQSATPFKSDSQPSSQEESKAEGAVTLADCLDEFERPELLDEENKWYCPNCKDHVQATKTLQIYKPPLVLVINLKRFKHGKQRIGMYGYGGGGGGGGKLQTFVDFQIEGLDLKPYILIQDGQTYVYDLFGISNHYGGCGGGHYTAYAKNWKENQWYSLDDSSCSRTSPTKIISDAAYNLFYRRRQAIELDNINYDLIKQSATEESLERFKQQ